MHTIRLQGCWRGDVDGGFRRTFHWVAKLAPGDRVFLAFSSMGPSVEFAINDRRLICNDAETNTARFDVTPFLTSSNEITIRGNNVSGDATSAEQLVGDVRLEVEEANS